jgi:CheY-like chemotaxis protein
MAVVMVVDDDRDMLDLYGTLLEDLGYEAVLRSGLNVTRPQALPQSSESSPS